MQRFTELPRHKCHVNGQSTEGSREGTVLSLRKSPPPVTSDVNIQAQHGKVLVEKHLEEKVRTLSFEKHRGSSGIQVKLPVYQVHKPETESPIGCWTWTWGLRNSRLPSSCIISWKSLTSKLLSLCDFLVSHRESSFQNW